MRNDDKCVRYDNDYDWYDVMINIIWLWSMTDNVYGYDYDEVTTCAVINDDIAYIDSYIICVWW